MRCANEFVSYLVLSIGLVVYVLRATSTRTAVFFSIPFRNKNFLNDRLCPERVIPGNMDCIINYYFILLFGLAAALGGRA